MDVLETGLEWLTCEMIGNNLIQEYVTKNMFITANNNIRNVQGYVFLSSVPLLPVNGYDYSSLFFTTEEVEEIRDNCP